MSNGPIEPAAEFRQLANAYRQMYLALVQEGFSTQEALAIIGYTISGAMGGGKP